MKLKFTEKDFATFRAFENAVKRQLGETTYVGTDHMVVVVDYPPALRGMLRPFPEQKQYEFEF